MDTDGIIQILAELAKSENLLVESWDNCTGYPQMADNDLGYYTGYPQIAVSDLGIKAPSDTSTTGPTGRSASDIPIGQMGDVEGKYILTDWWYIIVYLKL
ncbi:hypothetical protein AVEN_143364-1 [Araneus ventricosus]|uniref:Uncharacterized protein n=1 Tax=Araneus ventricosus TaxID=182803 RepID=A0A4Y2ADX7_ARAVE|nr:hypothetical protein AVEN_143364-1 [Araneus ventricosus]